MLMENLLGLAHHLGRDARLIVNAFLQHGRRIDVVLGREQDNTGVWKASSFALVTIAGHVVFHHPINLELGLAMATTSTPVSPPASRSGHFRFVIYAFALIFLTLVGIGVWLYSTARSALPQLEGRLKLSGLSATVT